MPDNEVGSSPSSVSRTEQVPAAPAPPAPTFVGNSNDVLAVIAATMAGMAGLCCLTWGYGIYCLPVIGLVVGAIAVFNASASVNPDRTRRLGWISVAISGTVLAVIFVAVVIFVVAYGALIVAVFKSTPSFPTPIPTRFR